MVLVVAGVVLQFLLPTPLQFIHNMPRRVCLCVRPNCSTPPHVVLVVRHLPPQVAMCVRPITPPCPWTLRTFVVSADIVRTSVGVALHCVRAVVLGSSGFVGVFFPLLTNLKNRAAGVPLVALWVPHPLRAQAFPQDASGAPVVAHCVPDPLGVGKLGALGGRFAVFAAHSPPHSGRPPPASLCFRGHVVRRALLCG